jgi:hypothetical protein
MKKFQKTLAVVVFAAALLLAVGNGVTIQGGEPIYPPIFKI